MELSEHTSALGRWRTAHRAADMRLRAYVHGFMASSSELPSLISERHLPSLEVPMVMNFAAPHWRLTVPDEKPRALTGAWVVGLHNRHHLSQAVGERHFMIVRFTPLGAHLFFGLPMHQLVNQAIDIRDIEPTLARVINDRLCAARNWSDRFRSMEALIAERVDHERIPTAVSLVWRELSVNANRVALSRLTSELDCSHRSLIAQFRTCIGLPPKTIARLQRFNHVVALLNSQFSTTSEPAGKPYIEVESPTGRVRSAVQWADVAADCGYFDQSHLIKEFQQFAGTTPANVARQLSY